MNEADMKWFLAFLALIILAPAGYAVLTENHKLNVKRDIVVACYNAGNRNCEQLWNNTIEEVREVR